MISTLESNGPTLLQSLLQTASVSASTISSLEKKGLVETYAEAIRRDPLSEDSRSVSPKFTR